MKVVKCLEHIPKVYWGNVLEDYSTIGGSGFKTLIDSDFFPLPEQGDEVEVSDDGKHWSETAAWYFISHFGELRDPFLVYDDDKDIPSSYKYIRPIPVESNKNRDEFCERFYEDKEKVVIPSCQTIETVLKYLLVKVKDMEFEDDFKKKK